MPQAYLHDTARILYPPFSCDDAMPFLDAQQMGKLQPLLDNIYRVPQQKKKERKEHLERKKEIKFLQTYLQITFYFRHILCNLWLAKFNSEISIATSVSEISIAT